MARCTSLPLSGKLKTLAREMLMDLSAILISTDDDYIIIYIPHHYHGDRDHSIFPPFYCCIMHFRHWHLSIIAFPSLLGAFIIYIIIIIIIFIIILIIHTHHQYCTFYHCTFLSLAKSKRGISLSGSIDPGRVPLGGKREGHGGFFNEFGYYGVGEIKAIGF